MAYSKTNWVDNTTPIDKNNLNKIEQGIYDNSLVVDAVTNTLNPTDTETYKTAELTEGQITDVIGVSDIVIKGQTSQNGEPTPSSPVDVNVVSGSNVIETSNKNVLNLKKAIAVRACTIQLQSNNIKITTDGTNNGIIKIPCVLNPGDYYLHFEGTTNIINVAFYNSNEEKIIGSNLNSSMAITLNDKLAFIQINLTNVAGTYTLDFNKIYINLGSTDLGYEPHQGKELPLDLPIENLFNSTPTSQSNVTYQNNIITFSSISSGTQYIVFPTNNNIEGETYTVSFDAVSTIDNATFTFDGQPDNATSTIEYFKDSNFVINTTKKRFSVTGIIPNGLTGFRFFRTTSNVSPSATITISNIQIEKGSNPNVYTSYGTTPIELCKIGNYQDYFYKSGSKWYLHKEINKKVLNGSENWQLANSGTSNYYYYYNLGHTTIQSSSIASTHYLYAFISNSNTEQGILVLADGNIRIRYGTENTVANFKTWLATNNVSVYYPLATATDTEIIDTTLISQLEAIYNAPLYEQTNITQTNNDLPIVLDITACKDNINGIKAFIRK